MKTVLITGASRGLGRELAVDFVKAGWSVAITARHTGTLDAVTQELGGMRSAESQEILALPADLADQAAPGQLIGNLRRHWTRLDALINNAGVQGPIGKVWECDPVAWEAAFRVLLYAPVALCRLTVPWMEAGGGGAIVNVSGGGASGPRPGFSSYAAAKTALVRFTETLAAECAGMGVTVNAVAPGAMPSAMLEEITAAGVSAAGEKEFGAAEKALLLADSAAFRRAAECIRFLCGPEAKAISGRLVSAVWDRYRDWADHAGELAGTDLYTLRRIAGRDRGVDWGDT